MMLACLLILQISAKPLGFLYSPSGLVKVQGKAISGLARILPMSAISIGPGGQATFFENGTGNRMILLGPLTAKSTSSSVIIQSGKTKLLGKLKISAMTSDRGFRGSAGHIVRGGPEASFATAFPFGLIRPIATQIRWSGQFAVEEFRVRIRDETSEEIFSLVVSAEKHEAMIPAQALKPGKRYNIDIIALLHGENVGEVELSVTTIDALASVELASAQKNSYGLAWAEFLDAAGLLAEAADEYGKELQNTEAKARQRELMKNSEIKK